MDKLSNLALLAQMLESAEKNIQSAKQILREIMGSKAPISAIAEKAKTVSISGGGKIIEGVFDGQNMMGPDGKKYPVPANYASKSKLVEGDVLKLTISDDGSFIYKQIGPVEREKKLGILSQTENGEYRVIVDGKSHRVLLASLTYFKAEPGDEVAIVVPQGQDSEWAAVENVIKHDGTPGPGAIADSPKPDEDIDRDLDLE
ncbi:MAG: hypothetical protein A3C85_00695 [Candidatus Doudnabacteria bacterium RIFCSPHIGHO2_02_FULL_48_21]|nr:MAG: hypothetical protein A3K05_04410 [Candidatus Doudnabacteria bacterium RIFCSPHIGHO2_01_48_18]OGE91133.1 MAG: hypothetical protein A3F44_02305 [Candidatus Doudnabacteria bacterium RIFCSPHIGHO2_12_FULL_47_25]OGE93877.1 MAG: hypothetical protein A3C85_00695 [Candidatus Doudnabacteria bacterium RIFCSPHIGHO2_02_FULL_48_21]OGF00403.1 MAG: hypothetical protein A3G07_00670 [Candidatus Doudnabacteria bacterium RIFCSPLOWO2_12_FULL_47_12]